MKVKIGDKIYNGEKEPVMVTLTEEEKEQINNMSPDNKGYCVYPDTKEWTENNFAKIVKWMKTETEENK